MATLKDAYVGDVGYQVFLPTGEDVATASSLKIRYRKPDGTEGEWTASDHQEGTEFGVRYITQSAADLDQAGVWTLDVELTGFAGFTGSSSSTTMEVGRPRPGA